jgi:poly(A) polymerase
LAEVLAVVAGEPRPLLAAGVLAALEAFRSGAQPVPVFPLRGADFVSAGVAKGPEVGRLLARARALWVEKGCPTDAASAETLLRRALEEPPEASPTRL